MTELLGGEAALVTGGGRGIGRGIASELARHGCDVAVNDIDVETANATAEALAESFGVETVAVPGDVTDVEDVAGMVGDTIDAFDGLDVLVNNAAIIDPESYEEIDAESWERVLDVDLNGVQNCTAAAYDELKGGGRIVNVASTAGLRVSLLAGAHYTSSKWGVIGLTKHVAQVGGGVDVRANAVCPGATETERIVEMTTEAERAESAADEFPLGRWGTPEDVGKATVFLASDLSSFVTGVALPVDGGFTIL